MREEEEADEADDDDDLWGDGQGFADGSDEK